MVDAATGSNMQRYSDSVTRELFLGRAALFDTMKDLMLDAIGAIVIAITSCTSYKKKKIHIARRWYIEKKHNFPTVVEEDKTDILSE